LQSRSLLDQVATMPGEQLQLLVSCVPGRLQQSEAVDGSSKDAFEVLVVRLISALPGNR
jgi:hypothetical protein